jgi:hypothetical protein
LSAYKEGSGNSERISGKTNNVEIVIENNPRRTIEKNENRNKTLFLDYMKRAKTKRWGNAKFCQTKSQSLKPNEKSCPTKIKSRKSLRLVWHENPITLEPNKE